MEQREITFPVSLLDRYGRLLHPGYSREMKLRYRRKDVKKPLRLKEWDSYIVIAEDVALRLTVSDAGYARWDSVTLFDRSGDRAAAEEFIGPAAPGRARLPESGDEGDVHRSGSDHSIHFLHSAPGERTLIAQVRNFGGEGSLSARLRLFDEPAESLVTALPFEKEGEWSYSRKTVGFRAEGYIRWGGRTWELGGGESRATLDWNRGVWPRECGRLWCCGVGTDAEGVPFGLALGEGSGADEAATENMLFIDGAACKLGKLSFTLPEENGGAWQIADGEGRLELLFTPAQEKTSRKDLKLVSTELRQTVGSISGRVTAPDGRSIELRELPGFAERAHNRW